MADLGANGKQPSPSGATQGAPRADTFVSWLSQQGEATFIPPYSGHASEGEEGGGGATTSTASRHLGGRRYSRG
jgi:hypothetical protein